MVQYVEGKSALEMKHQFLDTFKNLSSSAPTTYQNLVGSHIPGSMKIAAIEKEYGFNGNLEYCIRTYLLDRQFPEGEGRRHRVKKQNLPPLCDPQVFLFLAGIN